MSNPNDGSRKDKKFVSSAMKSFGKLKVKQKEKAQSIPTTTTAAVGFNAHSSLGVPVDQLMPRDAPSFDGGFATSNFDGSDKNVGILPSASEDSEDSMAILPVDQPKRAKLKQRTAPSDRPDYPVDEWLRNIVDLEKLAKTAGAATDWRQIEPNATIVYSEDYARYALGQLHNLSKALEAATTMALRHDRNNEAMLKLRSDYPIVVATIAQYIECTPPVLGHDTMCNFKKDEILDAAAEQDAQKGTTGLYEYWMEKGVELVKPLPM